MNTNFDTKTAIVLINLGSPDNPTLPAVRKYLKQFLSDPYVVDLPTWLRWILVNMCIIPFRTHKTSQAYSKIWTSTGSPLIINSIKLKNALSVYLGSKYEVILGMRYGQPNIATAITELGSKNLDRIIIVPLFPQYASATTGSIKAEISTLLAKHAAHIPYDFITDFFDHPDFISSLSSQIKQHLQNINSDHILFSYHGLPERQVRAICHQKKCPRTQEMPCPSINQQNRLCYRAQCFQTTRLIADQLKLSAHKYTVTFQSRLGKASWIKPYTDEILPKLRKKNIAHLTLVCPAFVADCLETLEEIDIGLRAAWMSLGGKEFSFIPCLNANYDWAVALANIIKDNTSTIEGMPA